MREKDVTPFQGFSIFCSVSQGGALGWYVSLRWGFRVAASTMFYILVLCKRSMGIS